MSQGKQKFTSSTQTEQSRHLESVISLGKRIVDELNLASSNDTLGRWMAHYIAELIVLAEKTTDPAERIRAQEKCCATIEHLWLHRSILPPSARPLSNLEGILKSIENFRDEQTPWSRLLTRDIDHLSSPWMAFIRVIEGSGLRACRIALLTAIAEESFGNEKRWVEEYGSMLSENEMNLIRVLDSWLSSEQPWHSRKDHISIADLAPDVRRKHVLTEIKACIAEVINAGEKLRADISKSNKPNHSSKKLRKRIKK